MNGPCGRDCAAAPSRQLRGVCAKQCHTTRQMTYVAVAPCESLWARARAGGVSVRHHPLTIELLPTSPFVFRKWPLEDCVSASPGCAAASRRPASGAARSPGSAGASRWAVAGAPAWGTPAPPQRTRTRAPCFRVRRVTGAPMWRVAARHPGARSRVHLVREKGEWGRVPGRCI